jgi:hypothetical protein
MIVIHVDKNSEATDQIKKFIKDTGVGRQVKLHVTTGKLPVLVATSGNYNGLSSVMSYLKGYFAYERKNSQKA